MAHRVLFDETHLHITLNRLCYQLIEVYDQFEDTILIGVQPRGIFFSNRIYAQLCKITGLQEIVYGQLDITFHRDDFRHRDDLVVANQTHIPISLDQKKVILLDDVLYTGRTIRAALDALLAYGRPAEVSLCVLVDRRFSRELPISANFIGCNVDSLNSESVKVYWQEKEQTDQIIIYSPSSTSPATCPA